MSNFRDILRVQGVKAKGYGIIPKIVMLDRKLTIEAKAIYSYFCSYAGAGDTAFPSRNKICEDLGVGKTRYYKHLNLLIEFGYIEIEQVRNRFGKFKHNIYTLTDKPIPKIVDKIEDRKEDLPSTQNEDMEEGKVNSEVKPGPQNRDTDNRNTANQDTNINSPFYNQQSFSKSSIFHSPEDSNNYKNSEKERQNEVTTNEFQNILNNSGYDQFEEKYSSAIEQSLRLLYYSDKPIKINNMSVPTSQVRKDLERLRWKHLDLALRDFKNQAEIQEIRYPAGYLSRCIYNAIFQSDLKLEAELRHNGSI